MLARKLHCCTTTIHNKTPLDEQTQIYTTTIEILSLFLSPSIFCYKNRRRFGGSWRQEEADEFLFVFFSSPMQQLIINDANFSVDWRKLSSVEFLFKRGDTGWRKRCKATRNWVALRPTDDASRHHLFWAMRDHFSFIFLFLILVVSSRCIVLLYTQHCAVAGGVNGLVTLALTVSRALRTAHDTRCKYRSERKVCLWQWQWQWQWQRNDSCFDKDTTTTYIYSTTKTSMR